MEALEQKTIDYRLRKRFGRAEMDRVLTKSVLNRPNGESDFREIIEQAIGHDTITRIVEIGTYNGIGATILSAYGDVVTIDVQEQFDTADIVERFAVGDITRVLGVSEKTRTGLLAGLDFQLAFVDGEHKYKNVARDFNDVRRCGRVIFHDNDDTQPDVMRFVDGLTDGTVTTRGHFALWVANDA